MIFAPPGYANSIAFSSACMRGHCCTMRRPNSETVQAYNFEPVAFFYCASRLYKRNRNFVDAPACVATADSLAVRTPRRFQFTILGCRLSFARPGYTNCIGCSSTHPLAWPPLICARCRSTSAAVQIYGFGAFAHHIFCRRTGMFAHLFDAPSEFRGCSSLRF